MGLSVFPAPSASAKEKKIASFKSSGTWTVPTGVTYAIAHCLGGGGGAGRGSAGDGGDSTVAFTSTVTAAGGKKQDGDGSLIYRTSTRAGAANSGQGATYAGAEAGADNSIGPQGSIEGGNGAYICEGSTVTPAASITVTIGAGGTAGTGGSAGGSGYVYIEYYQ